MSCARKYIHNKEEQVAHEYQTMHAGHTEFNNLICTDMDIYQYTVPRSEVWGGAFIEPKSEWIISILFVFIYSFWFPHLTFIHPLITYLLTLATMHTCFFVWDPEQLLMSHPVDSMYLKTSPCSDTVQFCPDTQLSTHVVFSRQGPETPRSSHFPSDHVNVSTVISSTCLHPLSHPIRRPSLTPPVIPDLMSASGNYRQLIMCDSLSLSVSNCAPRCVERKRQRWNCLY